MIRLKSHRQMELMEEAGRITGEALLCARRYVEPGISTYELDMIIRDFMEKHGAKPSFYMYGGFPGNSCLSINDEVIHGIPSKKRILRDGDILKIDLGACVGGYHGDAARTVPVGKVSEEALKLIDVTRQCFFEGITAAKAGMRLGDIGSRIQAYAEKNGYSVVRRYVGHGIGSDVHEEPNVPNYGTPGRGLRLHDGMTIAVEPMINAGTKDVVEMSDGWTVKTADGKLSAHYENTIAILPDGPKILTLADKDW